MIAKRQRLGRGQAWLALRLGGVAAALLVANLAHVVACTATDGPPPGPAPVVVSVEAAEVVAKRSDAGAPIGCCTFSVVVKYDIAANDFVRHEIITWDDTRTSRTRFQYIPTNVNGEVDEAAGAGPGVVRRSLELTATLPGVLVDGSNNAKHGFVVTLNAAGGGVSADVAGTVSVR